MSPYELRWFLSSQAVQKEQLNAKICLMGYSGVQAGDVQVCHLSLLLLSTYVLKVFLRET